MVSLALYFSILSYKIKEKRALLACSRIQFCHKEGVLGGTNSAKDAYKYHGVFLSYRKAARLLCSFQVVNEFHQLLRLGSQICHRSGRLIHGMHILLGNDVDVFYGLIDFLRGG